MNKEFEVIIGNAGNIADIPTSVIIFNRRNTDAIRPMNILRDKDKTGKVTKDRLAEEIGKDILKLLESETKDSKKQIVGKDGKPRQVMLVALVQEYM